MIRRRAEALIAAGRRLPGPRLIQALLTDPAVSANVKPPVWASSDGTRRLLFRPDGKGGGRIDLTGASRLSKDERRDALKALDAQLRSLSEA